VQGKKRMIEFISFKKFFNLKTFTCIYLFLAGLGPGKIMLSTLILYFLVISIVLNFRKNKISIPSYFGIFLWFLFIILYYFQYETPYMPEKINGKLDFFMYQLKAIPVLCIFILFVSTKSNIDKFHYLECISFGMLAIASINTIATLVHLDPPYYGRAWEFFSNGVMNSPGTTILASIPALLLLSFVNTDKLKKFTYIYLLAITLVLGTIINLIFLARSFFFIIFLILIFKIFFFILKSRTNGKTLIHKKSLIYIFISLFFLIIIIFLFRESIHLVINRIIHGDYMVKFLHTWEYFSLIKENFFIYPSSNYFRPEQFWFHNFFFDSHRTSGPFVAILAYIIFLFTGIKSLINLKRNRSDSRELFILFLSFFPILYTSIPWESSEYQLIFFYSALTGWIINPGNNKTISKL
jgi:hypothetical protein